MGIAVQRGAFFDLGDFPFRAERKRWRKEEFRCWV